MISSIDLEYELESKGYLSLNKFCKYLKQFHPGAYVSYPTALNLVKEGKLRAHKVGKQYRVSRLEAQRWVEEGNWERQVASPYSTTPGNFDY